MNTCMFNSFSLMQCLLWELKYSSPELKYQVNYFFCILWKFSIAFQNLFVPQTVREMLVFFLIVYSTQPLCCGQLLFISLNTYLQVPFKIIFPHTVVSVARKYSWENPAAVNPQVQQQWDAQHQLIDGWAEGGISQVQWARLSPCMFWGWGESQEL